jgi:hypothetical protein
VFSRSIGEPRLDDVTAIREKLRTEVLFSVRWSGWWFVESAGDHQFSLDADDDGYLKVDGEVVVDTGGFFGERREGGARELDRGFHTVEVGLQQVYGAGRLALHWVPPGGAESAIAPLPVADLYPARPLGLRRALRWLLDAWPRALRRLLGAGLLVASLLLLGRSALRFERLRGWLRALRRELDGRRARAALLAALFVLTFLAVLPYTGSVQGGDDTAYLNAATFDVKAWFFNRYAHVYLLKLFTAVSGGDPLFGVRVWWSFAFAGTVAAVALAVASVGPGLQLRTLAVTLFVLFAQSPLGLAGAAFADVSAMLFVTVAVAVYLHGISGDRERPPPRHEWHALAVGALTVAAFRSKEVGAILLLLPALYLISGERPSSAA